jgi:dTDP-4-dehydrorhamnose 3,5-epimerase-like enzyme
MIIEKIKTLSGYCRLSDPRGEFQGIINQGNWQEVNIVHSHASTTRGGHFHRRTTEVIFLLKGKAEVELALCDHLNEKIRITLLAGEGVQISPLTVHTFHYLEDSTHLQLLDLRFDPIQQDLINVYSNHDTSTDDSTDSTLD